MIKIRKGSDLREKKWNSPSIQESKIAAKFSKRFSIRTVTSLRDISEKTWVRSYPMISQVTLLPEGGSNTGSMPCLLRLWSAMHDVRVACAKKCAVAMGAHVLNHFINSSI